MRGDAGNQIHSHYCHSVFSIFLPSSPMLHKKKKKEVQRRSFTASVVPRKSEITVHSLHYYCFITMVEAKQSHILG